MKEVIKVDFLLIIYYVFFRIWRNCAKCNTYTIYSSFCFCLRFQDMEISYFNPSRDNFGTLHFKETHLLPKLTQKKLNNEPYILSTSDESTLKDFNVMLFPKILPSILLFAKCHNTKMFVLR